jgi:hypothetical protein
MFVVGLLFYMIVSPRLGPEIHPAYRIQAQCQETYGSQGPQRVFECVSGLLGKYMQEIDRDKMDRAYQGVR